MKTLTLRLFAAAMAAAMIALPGDMFAQTRRGSSTTRSSQTTSSSSSSKSGSSVSRSSASTSSRRNSAVSASSSRSSGNSGSSYSRRTSGSTSNRSTYSMNNPQDRRTTTATQNRRTTTATQNRNTQNRNTTAASGSNSSSQVRRSTGSTSNNSRRNTTGVNSGSTSRRSSVTTSNGNGSQVRRGTTTTRNTTGTSGSTVRSNGNTTRQDGSSTTRRRRTNTSTSGVSNGNASTDNLRNVRVNSNVTLGGLTNVNDNNNRNNSMNNMPTDGGRYVDNGRGRGYYYDDYRMDGHNLVRVHPWERDFISYSYVGSFWGHNPHYFGYRVEVLPPGFGRVRYYGIDYYRFNDIYYRPFGGHYVVCRPPVGVILERAIEDMIFHTVRFAFYNNVYRTYSGWDSYSRYIDRQNRTIAQNNAIIAQQNAQIAMNASSAQSSYSIANQLGLAQSFAYADRNYYYEDGVFYIVNENGQYQTIVPPAGALVEELPDDFTTITLGGQEFYRVDDTVYRVTMVSGHPYLEVLGQMYGQMARRYSLFN